MKAGALIAVVAGVVVIGLALMQPGYRVQSQCRYMRTEEACACYSNCVYRGVTGDRMYQPPSEAPMCPAVRAFPVFSSNREDDKPRVVEIDRTSKDPCKNPDAAISAP